MADPPHPPATGTTGVSFVIPVYNAEGSLPELVRRLREVMAAARIPCELIFVNDASRDRSMEVLHGLAGGSRDIVVLDLMRNYGQHNALLCGIRAARHPVIVTMDDDLQHPPELIPDLLAALTYDRDVVYGTPRDQPHGLLRGFASVVTKWTLQGVMGAEIARQVSALRIFRTHLREAFRDYRGPFVNIDVLLTWGTSRFAAIPIRHEPRLQGVSGYSFWKLVTHTFNMLTGFTIWPLQAASLLGFALTLFGFIVLAFVLIRTWLENAAPAGFPFLASIIAIFSGAQMFAIGIIGEYLARMHFRLMDKPPYCVRSASGPAPPPGAPEDAA